MHNHYFNPPIFLVIFWYWESTRMLFKQFSYSHPLFTLLCCMEIEYRSYSTYPIILLYDTRVSKRAVIWQFIGFSFPSFHSVFFFFSSLFLSLSLFIIQSNTNSWLKFLIFYRFFRCHLELLLFNEFHYIMINLQFFILICPKVFEILCKFN